MKLSIVVPIYNVELYLDECVQSILSQTFTDFELILVDDGSPDNCPQMCDDWAKKDARIKVIHQINSGPHASRKVGIELTQGKYIGFVDSDDWVKPNMFSVLVNAMEMYNADLVQCGHIYEGKNKELESKSAEVLIFNDVKESILYPFSQTTSTIYPFNNSVWNKLYKCDVMKKAINKIEIKSNLGEDFLLNLLYLPECSKVIMLKDECNYFHRSNSQSIMHGCCDIFYNRTLFFNQELEDISKYIGLYGNGVKMLKDFNMVYTIFSIVHSGFKPAQKLYFLKRSLAQIKDDKNILRYFKSNRLRQKLFLSAIYLLKKVKLL